MIPIKIHKFSYMGIFQVPYHLIHGHACAEEAILKIWVIKVNAVIKWTFTTNYESNITDTITLHHTVIPYCTWCIFLQEEICLDNSLKWIVEITPEKTALPLQRIHEAYTTEPRPILNNTNLHIKNHLFGFLWNAPLLMFFLGEQARPLTSFKRCEIFPKGCKFTSNAT